MKPTPVSDIIIAKFQRKTIYKVQSLRGAINIFGNICADGNDGMYHPYIARVYTLLSVYLWTDNKKDEAFEALDCALEHFRRFEKYCKGTEDYTAPLVHMVRYDVANGDSRPQISYKTLVEDWPWWKVPEESLVKSEMQADSRWNEWVAKTSSHNKNR